MFASKLQLVCIWAPATRREVCPRLLQSMSIKILNPKCNLRKLLPNLRNSKYPIFCSQMRSNKSLPKVLQWYQHRDQLSLGYDTRVWTADEVKLPCAEQLGSECSPKMQWWKEKYLELSGRYKMTLKLFKSNTALYKIFINEPLPQCKVSFKCWFIWIRIRVAAEWLLTRKGLAG